MQKIIVIGSGGAGKSTFAIQLGKILAIPLTHLDALFWQPGWVETPEDIWEEKLKELMQQERWLLDGNYSGSLDLRMQAADTIIFLDFPRLLCSYRLLKRQLMYAGKSRPDMNEGCPEKLGWAMLTWVWTYPEKRRPLVQKKLALYAPGRRIVHLRNPKAARLFLEAQRQANMIQKT